jgi:predicted Zn-dependent peptidase
MRNRLPLILILLAAGWLMAQVAPVLASDPIAADARGLVDELREIRLENGLRVFVLERHYSPTFAAYYRFNVGSAFDPKGRSGIAHLLEHMMFKGTRDIGTLDAAKEARIMARQEELWHEKDALLEAREDPFASFDAQRLADIEVEIARLTDEHKQLTLKNEYDELLTRAGGARINASTGNDATNYYVMLPANQLEFWFQLERERLLHPVFREFYSERDVVAQERRQGIENNPDGLAWVALDASVFRAHPYGIPVIGWSRDIERYDCDDARDYFRTFYSPGNCVMVLVGDVDAGRVEQLARKYLGDWEHQEVPRPHVTAEEPQRGERRTAIEFDAEPSLLMAWPAVREGHPDECALEILARILGGMASARLDRSLVQEERVASNIYSSNESQRYGGKFVIGGSPRQGHALGELEASILAAVSRLQNEGVSELELERAKVAMEVWWVRRLDSNLRLAFTIGGAVGTAGSPDYLFQYEERMMAVTADDVARVAREYLQPARLNVVAVERPEGSSGPLPRAARGERAGASHAHGGPAGPRGTAHSQGFARTMKTIEAAKPVEIDVPEVGRDVERVVLPSGITVFVKEDHTAPAITLAFTFLGGSNTTPVEELAPFAVAGDLLTQGGTADLDPQALEDRLDELGMNFNWWIGDTQSGGRFWSLSRNFDESFDLAVAMLRQPRLDPDRLEVIKGQYIDRMRRRFDRPPGGVRVLADYLLHGDHPRLGYVTTRAQIEALTPADVQRALDRYLGADNLYITATGDFAKAELLEAIEAKLGGWKHGAERERVWITRPPAARPGVFIVEKDVPQPAITFIQELPIDRTISPKEHAAVEILNEILGGSGFRSRLMERIRSDEGLTYGIYSRLNHDQREGVPGQFSISYQTRREAAGHSIAAVLEEYEKICAEPVSEAEVREQIQAWSNSFVFNYENEAYSVRRLMDNELDEQPYDFDRQRLAEIQQVTPADVAAAARKYLDPQNVTIAIFGQLTAEDEEALRARFPVTKLAREEVFRGGY